MVERVEGGREVESSTVPLQVQCERETGNERG